MKRNMKSLLALVLVAVLTLGNLSGLGPAVSKAADTMIYAVTATKTTVSKDGENLEVTVTGENLPEKLYYKRIYVGLDDFGEDFDYSVDSSGVEVDATGDAEMRTIVVPMPAASEYPTASGWKVAIDTEQYGTYTRKCKKISIDGLEVTTPEIQTVEVSKESVSAAGETVTVTVKGTALPSEAYYKLYYQWEMNGRTFDSSYGIGSLVALTGEDSTEKTFDVAIPAESEPGTEIVGWKVAVCLSMNGTYVKSGVMSISAEETPDVPEVPEVDNKVLNVKVVDKDGNPVADVPLVLEGESYNPDVKIGTTNDNGLLSYVLQDEADDYTLKPVKDSGFNCENPAEIYIGTDTDTFEPIVEEVNGEEYTGEVTLVVEKEEVKADPVLTSVEATKASVSKDGETLTITVKGENLPDTLYYALKYVADDGFGDTMDNTVDWTGKAVAATGTATEKTIEVPIPSTTVYPKALSWKVRVGLSSNTYDGTYKTTSEIAIDGVEVPVTPEIKTVAVSKESVSAAGETVTVTVEGTALPETLYYKVYYIGQYGDSAINYAGTSVTATGTEEEKTFEVEIPATSSIEYDMTGWKVSVGLAQYSSSYVKSGEISILEDETPVIPEVDKTELLAKITALAGLKAEDYTVASFKALQTAIDEATKVFNNEEATEEEVAEALATLQTAEDGLLALADLPKAPSSVKAVLSGAHNTVKVTWSKVERADGYLVSYKKAADEAWSAAVATTATSYTQKGLAANTTYQFKVTPYVDKNGAVYDEAQNKVAEIKTKKNVKAPSSVKATLSGGYDDVKVSWKKVTGADSYRVYYKRSTSTSYTVLTTTTKLSATKKNLADGVKYTFKVVPCYKDGSKTVEGFYSKKASVYTLKKLAAPKVSKVNSKKVKVSWANINGESGYQISRSTKKTGTNIVSTYSTTSGKTKTLSVTKGKKYYYKVRAYKTVDGKKIYGPWSNVKAYTLK